MCTCVSFKSKPWGSGDSFFYNVLPPVTWPVSPPPHQEEWAVHRGLCNGNTKEPQIANFSSTASLTPIQQEILISNRTIHLKYVSQGPVFSWLDSSFLLSAEKYLLVLMYTVDLSIHLLQNILISSKFWQLWIKLL